jgi:radical SAM protein with 4Fe4S-binding SPASM domain
MGCTDRLVVPRFTKEEIESAVDNNRLLTMEIEFNSDCNFRCVYCYAVNGKPPDRELTPGEFRDVILQARDLGARRIIVLGGEPTLYPKLMEMVLFIKEQGMDVEIYTNGASVTGDFARRLYEAGAMVVLKMNTFDRKKQDMISGAAGAYDQIQNAFGNLLDAGYPGPYRRLGVSTVICSHNYDELEKLWRWLREKDISPYFEMITPQGRAKNRDSLFVDCEEIRELFHKLSEIDREFGFEWTPKPPIAGIDCQRHQYSCVVTSVGNVTPCVGVDIPVGNVREQKLGDIIAASDVVQELRNYRDHIKGPCRNCEHISNCYGCRGAAYHLVGDYLASDPHCWKQGACGSGKKKPGLPAMAEEFIPHRPPMVLVDRLVQVTDTVIVAETDPGGDSIFSESGVVDEVAFLEMIAQAMAARTGYINAGSEEPEVGFLVGVKGLKVYGNASVGDRLRVEIDGITEFGGGFGAARGIVMRQGTMLAEGELRVWHGKET